ncbi:Gfo/Idh/MocA family oxidoreductase [Candidatus Pelagibacter bacterium nBUS_32]|uniref:Gfo/Idh/MocA family oxidoreductase n=1 Tax=Candidatus Pelagibacter bacterium nBUS_32 TaxID=3374192 RepID=UPI003EB8B157
MKNIINIAVVGLGQVGIYLLNELNTKKKDIELKTGKKINIVAVSAKDINKKRQFKVDKKIFFKNPLEILNKKKVDILFEAIGLADGISKKVVETALRKTIHVITPNKALISKHGNYLAKIAELNNVNLEFEAFCCRRNTHIKNYQRRACYK